MIIDPTDLPQKDIYKLLIGTVVPRPIAWVSTKSKEGALNLAPFSFFTVASSEPAMICLSIGPGEEERINTTKDTMVNINETGEFVVNVVNISQANNMYKSSYEFQADVDEFKVLGVTPESCKIVKAERVKESPVNLECKLEKIIPLGHDTLIIGRVLIFHIQDELYSKGKINMQKLEPIGRMAGNYAKIDNLIELPNDDI